MAEENSKIELTYGEALDLHWLMGGMPEIASKFPDREGLDLLRVHLPLMQIQQQLRPHLETFYAARQKIGAEANGDEDVAAKVNELLGEKIEVSAKKLDKAYLTESGVTHRELRALRPVLDL